jgi:hypothetical protein
MPLPDLQADPDFTGSIAQAYLSNHGSTILINSVGEELLLDRAPGVEQAAPGGLPADGSWLRHSFITYQEPLQGGQGVQLDPQDRFNRTFSTAALKYTDSSAGGNKYINPIPQFTRYADIRPLRVAGDTPPVTINPPSGHMSYGQGRYHSEALDDNAQVIHLRYGVASFNSLTQFFTGFYSGELAANARAARYTDDTIAKWSVRLGNVVGLAIAPLFIIPNALLLVGTIARFVLNMPASKFMTMKPAMPMYWMAVNNIVNQMAVNSGLSSYVDTKQSNVIMKGGVGAEELQTSQVMNVVGNFLPKGLIKSNGTIDVFAIANRTNRADIDYQKRMAAAFKAAGPSASWFDVVRKHIGSSPEGNFAPGSTSFEVYFKRFVDFLDFSKVTSSGDAMEKDVRAKGYNEATQKYDGAAAETKGFGDYFTAQLNDGGEWVSYRVDYTGAVQDSFSNSTTESSLASKINSLSRSAREARFNVADGNIGGGLTTIVDAVKGVVSGIAEVVHVEGLAAFAGSAFVDIPKMWAESMTSLPKTTYNITLISPYGNPVSQLFNIWIPLATLIAGVLPLATGKQSHTSPFLCELHDRGRNMTRLGIVDSMSINRGTSNLGFNRDGQAMAIEVSFSVMDLSGMVAMPINQGFDILNPLEGLFDSDNAFSDYLMTLSGMKLSDMIYRAPMLKYQINRKLADMSTFFSASHLASYVASIPGVELLGAAMRGTDRQ